MTVTATPREKTNRRRTGADDVSTPTSNDERRYAEQAAKRRSERIVGVTDAISLLEIPLSGLAALEQSRLGPDEVGAFTLDIVALEGHKQPLAEAVCDLADTYPVLGTVLDRVAKATPFGALISVAVSLGLQIAENHRALPAHLRGLSPNLIARDDLTSQLRAEAAARAEARATEAARNGDRQPA